MFRQPRTKREPKTPSDITREQPEQVYTQYVPRGITFFEAAAQSSEAFAREGASSFFFFVG